MKKQVATSCYTQEAVVVVGVTLSCVGALVNCVGTRHLLMIYIYITRSLSMFAPFELRI